MRAGVATSVSHMFSFSPALLPFCVLELLSPRRAVGGGGVTLPAVQLCCAQRAPSLNKPTKHTLPALLPKLSPAKLLGNVCAPSPNPLKATSYLPVLGQCCLRLLLPSPGLIPGVFAESKPSPGAAFALPEQPCPVCSVLSLGYRARSSQASLHEIELFCTVGSSGVNRTFPGRSH